MRALPALPQTKPDQQRDEHSAHRRRWSPGLSHATTIPAPGVAVCPGRGCCVRLDGVSHPHTHDPVDLPADRRRRANRLTLAVLVPAALLTAIAMIWLWPPKVSVPDEPGGAQNVAGQVTAVHTMPCPPVDPGTPDALKPTACGTVSLKLLDGPDTGKNIDTDMPSGPGAPTVAVGDTLTLMYLPDLAAGQQPYQIADHQRSTQLWLIGAAFVLAVVAFGRLRGISALVGLAITFAVLLMFIVPAILAGSSPMLVAIVGSAAIMLAVLYLTHGLTVSTSVAVVGTLISLTLTGVLSGIAVAITHLTGVSDEQTTSMTFYYGNINMQGLLLAGILIGSLGVLDDVTVTQAATVAELARANPQLGVFALYKGATRVGRAHIAAVVNTLILAYAGSSMPLLISFAASNMKIGTIFTEQLMAQELVRGAVGTIGLIAAVPITTALAAFAAHRLSHDAAKPQPDADASPGQAPDRVSTGERYAKALLNPRQASAPWETERS
jgi:uncharacterized membrane protein